MGSTKRDRVIAVKKFSSFEEENRAEHHRLAALTHEERLHEFEILQERVWGTKWTKDAMVKTARIERVSWL